MSQQIQIPDLLLFHFAPAQHRKVHFYDNLGVICDVTCTSPDSLSLQVDNTSIQYFVNILKMQKGKGRGHFLGELQVENTSIQYFVNILKMQKGMGSGHFLGNVF